MVSASRAMTRSPDRGHSLTVDHGWRELADAVLAWLGKNGLHPRSAT
jgi:hypothetical protein